jgi:hypothetical protein
LADITLARCPSAETSITRETDVRS